MERRSTLICLTAVCCWAVTAAAQAQSKSTWSYYTITCDHNSRSDCQNETLGTILSSSETERDVRIDIKTPQLRLNEAINVTSLNSLTVIGKLDVQTRIICNGGSTDQNASTAGHGILLRNITGLVELRNLNLIFCGSEVDIDFDNKKYLSALTIIRCGNVQLIGVTIERSGGIGLMIANPLGGEVTIESAIFKENNMLHTSYSNRSMSQSPQVFGGGGVYIVFRNVSRQPHSGTILNFQSCTFENNTSNTSFHDHLYTNVQGKAREGYGRGGGVYVLLSSGLKNISVFFTGCTFTSNQAFIGSGLAVRIYGEKSKITEGIRVTIVDTIFRKNGCGDDGGIKQGLGGGAHLTFDSYLRKSQIVNSHYVIKNVRFVENCAELGGGVNHVSGKQSFNSTLNTNSMIFENCSFEGNTAHIGSAIFLASTIDRRLSLGQSIVIKFWDCRFTRNAALKTNYSASQIIPGGGTIYVSSYDIYFLGYTNFTKNNGSGLHIVNGLINFQNSNAMFANNRALMGGALALIGSSIIIVGQNRSYQFVGNSAVYKGGAIYVSLTDIVDFISSELCFIQCVDGDNSIVLRGKWNNTIIFTGNYAKDATAGHTIYATSLHPCQAISEDIELHMYTLVSTTEVFESRGIKFIKGPGDKEPPIATDGAVLQYNNTPLSIVPGERYRHNVKVMDDLNQTINASFWTSFKPEDKEVEIDITLASNFSTVITDRLNIRGEPKQKARIFMNLVSARQTFVQLNMEVLECPPGFRLKDKSECVCHANAHVGMFDCDLEKFQSHMISGYWAGYMNGSENRPKLVTSACPFCDYSLSEPDTEHPDFEIILPRLRSKLDKAVCGDTRTGVVCGKCRDSYTVHFHSPGFLCKPAEPLGCRLGWLFYILSEIVPVTVVFITVLVLNISFTSGAINSFILFSQLLASFDLTAGGIITFPRQSFKNASQGYQIFYGFFNLDYFNSESLSFCLWKGASALDMLAVKYITIFYTAVLIAIFVWAMNKCGGRWLGKCCRITTIKTSVVHGISSFLMIGYSQCVNVSLSLLLQVHISTARDDDFRPRRRVWLNGEIVHFSKEHLPYALPAIFSLLIIGILPPFLLLIYPLLNKVIAKLDLERFKLFACVLRVPSISSVKPFLDSFQGCFKDNMRFFAGLYFFYRWMFLLVHIGTVGFFEQYTVVGGVLVFILMLHAICQPYVKRMHNIIDALLLCNLVFINFISLFNFYRSNNPKIPNGALISSAAVQTVLIYIPALVMTVLMLMYFCKYIYGCICMSRMSTMAFVPKRARKLRDLVRTISLSNESSDEDFTHDQLMDEDVEFRRATCDYVEDQDCPEDTYNCN